MAFNCSVKNQKKSMFHKFISLYKHAIIKNYTFLQSDN